MYRHIQTIQAIRTYTYMSSSQESNPGLPVTKSNTLPTAPNRQCTYFKSVKIWYICLTRHFKNRCWAENKIKVIILKPPSCWHDICLSRSRPAGHVTHVANLYVLVCIVRIVRIVRIICIVCIDLYTYV